MGGQTTVRAFQYPGLAHPSEEIDPAENGGLKVGTGVQGSRPVCSECASWSLPRSAASLGSALAYLAQAQLWVRPQDFHPSLRVGAWDPLWVRRWGSGNSLGRSQLLSDSSGAEQKCQEPLGLQLVAAGGGVQRV